MKRILFNASIKILSIYVIFHCASLYGLVVWNGGSTPDVFNDDLSMQSANIVLDHTPVIIQALNQDITVSLTQDTVVQGFSGGNSALYLRPVVGRTITFIMNYDLTFQGSSASAPTPQDLLIIISGGGTVIFQFDGGITFTLTQNSSGGLGGTVQMFVTQDGSTLSCLRSGINPNSDVEVFLDQGALLSYLGYMAQPNANNAEIGNIIWNVQNSGTGRTILTLGQLAAVIVRGRLVTSIIPTLATINPSMPAGFEANFNVITDSNGGSLLIQNYNNTLGEFVWDPWDTLQVRENPPFGNFNGDQWGFIVGSYGQLNIGANSYLDYVSLTGTQCPSFANSSSEVKARNPSALFTDGQPSPDFTAPEINIAANAALFFRSGVDNQGNIRTLSDPNPFTINPLYRTPGAGFPVFDIEGPLLITGANTTGLLGTQVSKFELLSLEVAPTGGSLFVGGNQTIFPLRTFAATSQDILCTDEVETQYISYNNACFLNNGRVNLCAVSFNHTDQNHYVFENNDTISEPAYIGGETWKLIPCITKPKWAFANSRFNIQMSVALTGVDLLVPENSFCGAGCADNETMFVFYENGYAVDNGSGRQMILGTYVGSTACNGCTVINKDSQLDVMQTATCVNGANLLQELILSTTQNDNTIVQAIPAGADLTGQYSIQTIYLGNNSNISVGTNGDVGTSMEATLTTQYNFPLTTKPTLLIDGNFFSFETRGGENGLPATSNVTGQGGIFVDMNGTISIGSSVCGYRTNIGAMVTGSRNAVIDLPKNRVFFDPRVGIATWNINLNDPSQTVIVPSDVCYSEYNLNWMFVEKDYNIFTPYAVNCYDACSCPPVTTQNVSGIPVVEGTVQQFQIQGSRIGDPAHLKVAGGTIEELVMLVGFNSAEAPVAVLVLEHDAQVGLGTSHRNVNSLNASIQLGINGINIIMNGDQATVVLNEDIIINNTCSIIPGPDIAANAVLQFRSDCCTTLRVTKDGILDLSGFSTGQIVQFAGNVRVVFEPGSTVIYGANQGEGPTLRFAESSTCLFEPLVNTDGIIYGQDLLSTDTVRVVFAGVGVLEFTDCSRADLPLNAFVSIASDISSPCQEVEPVLQTVVRFKINDNAGFYIGDTDCKVPGGALQIGNLADAGGDPSITFSLILDGAQAKFEIGPQGFFGVGVGVVSKPATGHDFWQVAPTANVNQVTLDLQNGLIRHVQLYAGYDSRSSLAAFGQSVNGNAAGYNFAISPLPGSTPSNYSGILLSNTSVLGGGNFIAVSSTAGIFNPVVDEQNGTINNGQYAAGILSSRPVIRISAAQNINAFSAQNFLRVQDVLALAPTTNRGVVAPSDLRHQVRVGYVDSAGVVGSQGQIGRVEINNIIGKTPQTVVQQHTLALGTVQLSLESLGSGFLAPRPVMNVIEIGN